MELEKIVEELNKRFAAPLPEFYERRIIFWQDYDKEFADQIAEIRLAQAKVVVLTGTNNFVVKKFLTVEDQTSNVLVYNPIAYADKEDNWLRDIELFSEEFRADLVSLWLNELKLGESAECRKLVKQYRKFFQSKERRQKLQPFLAKIPQPRYIRQAIMAVLCGLRSMRVNDIVRAMLTAGLDKEVNPIYREFVDYGLETAYWSMVEQLSGYCERDKNDLGQQAIHMLLTAASRTMEDSVFIGLEGFMSPMHQAYCFDFISEWLHSDEVKQLEEIARFVEEEAHLPERFMMLTAAQLAGTECFPCIHECILNQLMTGIRNHLVDAASIVEIVGKRRTMVWYPAVANFYDGILQVAHMQEFFHNHAVGFHTTQAKEIWHEYTEDYYQMDTFYRQFHLAFAQSLQAQSNPVLDDLFKQVADWVEGLYKSWFLEGLGKNWSDICAQDLAAAGWVAGVAHQSDFYADRVQPMDSRIFVIISDAMRYEVAAQLAQELRREMQCTLDLDSMQAIFPSITKFGMAALLPHQALSVELRADHLVVLADSEPTDSNVRDKVLKQANPNSIAVQFKTIIAMKRAERSELVKGKDVVYIYHDTIDAASHVADAKVFPACDDAIAELKNLVRIIVNDFGGVNILLTADHGFLYTYHLLSENDKVDKTFRGKEIEYGRRYAITSANVKPDYLMSVRFLDGQADFAAFAPRESIRIKQNGGGLNFVHGGASLQELVVPVISYKHVRNGSLAYKKNKDRLGANPVELELLSAGRKISNMIFSLNFYQKDAVDEHHMPTTYTLYLVDSNQQTISDIKKLVADKTSTNNQERVFRCTFNLKAGKYDDAEAYYLLIVDEDGQVLPKKEEFQIEIAFAMDSFEWDGGL